MASFPRPSGPTDLFNWSLRLVSELVRRERRWASGLVEFDAGVASTIVTDERIRLDDVVMLTPATGTAEATRPFVGDGDVTPGQFTITHANAGAGRKFYFLSTRRDGA